MLRALLFDHCACRGVDNSEYVLAPLIRTIRSDHAQIDEMSTKIIGGLGGCQGSGEWEEQIANIHSQSNKQCCTIVVRARQSGIFCNGLLEELESILKATLIHSGECKVVQEVWLFWKSRYCALPERGFIVITAVGMCRLYVPNKCLEFFFGHSESYMIARLIVGAFTGPTLCRSPKGCCKYLM